MENTEALEREVEEVVQQPEAGAEVEAEAREPSTEAQPVDDGTETRARAMGWRPQEEYRGDPATWKDAKSFVDAADTNPAILRERFDTVARRNAELERKLTTVETDYQTRFQRLERMSAVALDRQRQQIEASYAAAMRQAVETGDVARYDQLSEARGEAVRQFDTVAQEARAQPEQAARAAPAPYQQTVDAWQAANPWYGKDQAMTALAQIESQRIQNEHPGLTVEQNLAEVRRSVARRFPEKFAMQQPQQRGSAAVEGGSRMASGAGAGRGWADIPAADRQVAVKQIKDGLFKDQADFAREYWSQG